MEQVLRILYVEDDPLYTEVIRRQFHKAGLAVRVDCVETPEGLRAALMLGQYEVVVSDFAIPWLDPMEPLWLTRELSPELPFIFLSGTVGEEQAVETLKQVATDYVFKQRIERLVPAVCRAVEEAGERSRSKQAEAAVERQNLELQSALEELRKSESQLRIAQQAANVGIWNWDLTTGESVLSEECFHLWGLVPQPGPVVRDWFALMHPDDRQYTQNLFDAALESGGPFLGEYRIVGTEGEVRWLMTRGSVVDRDASGRATRVSGVTLDITERKRTEEELQRAKAAAEQANRTKDHFLAVLSHELRAPLTPVVLGVSMLQDRPDLRPGGPRNVGDVLP